MLIYANQLLAQATYLLHRCEIGIDHLILGKEANKHISQNVQLFPLENSYTEFKQYILELVLHS